MPPSPSELTRGTLVRPLPQVLFRDVGGEMILLDPVDGTYFGLNEVGSRIWALLREEGRLGAVLERLLAEYAVGGEALWRDLTELVAELVRHGLVAIEAP